MKRILSVDVAFLLCGLVCAFIYLAHAQDNGNALKDDDDAEDMPAASARTNIAAEMKNGADEQPAADGEARPSPNGNGKVFEIPVGPADQSATNQLGGGARVGANTNLISIALDNVPVQDVVNMFAQISGANIITSVAFTNLYVTANLKNVEWKTALGLALGYVNLALIEDSSGILMVVTPEMYKQKIKLMEDTKPLVTKIFTPKYLNAVDLIEQIRLMNILSPRGTIITSQSRTQDKFNMKATSDTSLTGIQNPSITTAIIVSDIKEYVEKVEALVAQLDRREPQVFIEARIIDVGMTYDEKLGIDWGMLESFGVGASMKDVQWKVSDERKEVNNTDNADSKYDKRNNTDVVNQRYDINGQQYEESTTTRELDPAGNLVETTVITPTREISDTINRGRDITASTKDSVADTFSEAKMGTMLLSVSDVKLFLSALRQTGHADMLSHPVLIVGNKVEAKIHVGDQTWKISLKKTSAGTGVNITENYSEDASPVDLGMKLWVIPEIDVANDCIRMTIEPEMTVWLKDIKTEQGSIYPVISTRRLSTRVNVPNTHTVVIGGLVENKKSTAEKRVPLLGDIPLLGLLFRHTTDKDEKRNLLIMLSPTILDDRKPLTGMEAIAQLTVNRFEKNPLGPAKNIPTNQAFSQSLDTNLFTPSSGLAAPGGGQPAAPTAQPSKPASADGNPPQQSPVVVQPEVSARQPPQSPTPPPAKRVE